jgi:hypothetical protein
MPESEADAKLRVYRTLYRMNLSFAHVVAHCRALQESGMLTRKYALLYESYAQELRAEMNQAVVEVMDGVESDDMFRFGKARTAHEKEVRDPDDVFIEAEERRKELARQAKKRAARSKKANTAQLRINHKQRRTKHR